MRWVVIGAQGQLGQELLTFLDGQPRTNILGVDLPACDVLSPLSLELSVQPYAPQVIVNLAAFHEVDRCEEEAAQALAVNGAGALNVARLAKKVGAKLIHLSTDYVFSGIERDTPYTERDLPDPQSIYATSKYVGERLVMAAAPNAAFIRSCGLYGAYKPRAKPSNIVDAFLRFAQEGRTLRVVDDQICTPTWTRPLAEAVWLTAKYELGGPVHATPQGGCSWYAFASKLFELAGVKADLVPVSSADYGAKAPRPAYSVLDNTALRRAGHDPFDTWDACLEEFLRSR